MPELTNIQKHDEVLRFFCVNEMSDNFMPFEFIQEALKNYGYTFSNNELLQILDKLTDDKYIKFEKITHAKNGDITNYWRIKSDGIDFLKSGGYEELNIEKNNEKKTKELEMKLKELSIRDLKTKTFWSILGAIGGAVVTNLSDIGKFLIELFR